MVTATDKAKLARAAGADLTSLTSDNKAVAKAKSAKAIQVASAAAGRTVQRAQLQFQLMTGVDQSAATDTSLTASSTALTTQALTLQTAGVTITSVTSPLTALGAQVAASRVHTQRVGATALGIPVSPSVAQLRSANTVAARDVAAGTAAIVAARKDLSTATAALTALRTANAPAAPTGLSVTGMTSQSISLAWTSSAGATAYNVYQGATKVAFASGNSATVTVNAPSTTYSFSVSAANGLGESGKSASVSAATQAATTGSYNKVAYFDQWSVYQQAYYPKALMTSGAAAKLNVLQYAFENIDPTNLTCFEAIKPTSSDPSDPNEGDGSADAYADYQKLYGASNSVSGVADTWSQPLRGNFNQLKELKAKYPNLKVLVSLGGNTYSKYFSDVAATDASRKTFVASCIDMFIKGNLPSLDPDPAGGAGAAAGIFDGFDLDWEFPGTAAHVGNHFSEADKHNYTLLLAEFRSELDAYAASNGGEHYLLTAALPAGQNTISNFETNQIGQYLDFADLMAYDLHGAWDATGPTNFQSPLHESSNDPSAPVSPGTSKFTIDTAVTAWTTGLSAYGIPGGFPASKLNLGVPFYWRGWSGVIAGNTQGLYQAATGASPQFPISLAPGSAAWKELVTAGLTTNSAENFYDSTTQSSWIYDGHNFYTGDTPAAIAAKDTYLKSRGLGGAAAYALENDDPSASLLKAMAAGL
jgi:chitinase